MSGLARLLGFADVAACAAVWPWWHDEHPTASSDAAELPVAWADVSGVTLPASQVTAPVLDVAVGVGTTLPGA